MSDYLVKLYELPALEAALKKVEENGFVLRRALAPEKSIIVDWVRERFAPNWADECDVSFSNRPISCFIVIKEGEVAGFACYDSTGRAFFGPTGVGEEYRGSGLGRALLLRSLHAMWHEGYAYAIIGAGGGAEAFYRKAVGAVPIEGSKPGIYRGLLKRKG
ncbi:MAG TPA: GNAT family N-acetyltransferase [Opitutales bacterium]|nr:GNAT family N-acetyltransferase [Opitutales bacterium]